eukprot:GHVU01186015.1.p3 GENE.GHVU01186015.1~~GHVU01186015.1.p3  ORF type:complete len:128 (+),score=9.40 GHVU01186015.1:95-478(+)
MNRHKETRDAKIFSFSCQLHPLRLSSYARPSPTTACPSAPAGPTAIPQCVKALSSSPTNCALITASEKMNVRNISASCSVISLLVRPAAGAAARVEVLFFGKVFCGEQVSLFSSEVSRWSLSTALPP